MELEHQMLGSSAQLIIQTVSCRSLCVGVKGEVGTMGMQIKGLKDLDSCSDGQITE